jgi:hypothetical protein
VEAIKKHLALRRRARRGMGFWYRDHVCASRSGASSPLEQLLQNSIFPDRRLFLGISSGNPPPTRRRPQTVHCRDWIACGEALAFAKLSPAATSSTAARVRHEGAGSDEACGDVNPTRR